MRVIGVQTGSEGMADTPETITKWEQQILLKVFVQIKSLKKNFIHICSQLPHYWAAQYQTHCALHE